MIGTSDLRVEDLDDIAITDEEIDYFFAMIGRVFPNIQVNRSQIVYTFSGVRPLQRTEEGATGQISRDHIVQVIEPGEELAFPVLSLVGGKWTSFRAFSELAADQVLELLGRPRKISTAKIPIGGGKGYPKNSSKKEAYFKKLCETFQIEPHRLEGLFETYGTGVADLMEVHAAEASTLLESIPEISVGEIKYLLEDSDVVHLDDLVLRRTMLGKLGRVTPESLREIARVCKGELHWSDQETEREIERFTDILRAKHGMNHNEFIGA
jgi:glycerol-3-phosphate dehydrogenase